MTESNLLHRKIKSKLMKLGHTVKVKGVCLKSQWRLCTISEINTKQEFDNRKLLLIQLSRIKVKSDEHRLIANVMQGAEDKVYLGRNIYRVVKIDDLEVIIQD